MWNRTNNGPQKGARRQKLHQDQNNVGDKKLKPQYENHSGEPIK